MAIVDAPENIGPREGHGKRCYYCTEACDGYAADPGRWPIPLCHRDEPGRVKWHHIECVSGRLDETASLRSERDKLREALAGLVAVHTEPAGMTEEMIMGDQFTAHLSAVEERVREAVARARAALGET